MHRYRKEKRVLLISKKKAKEEGYVPINPAEIEPSFLIELVKDRVKGSKTAKEAEERIKKLFSPEPLVWVQNWGVNDSCGVLIQPYPGAENISIACSLL